jgi:transposase
MDLTDEQWEVLEPLIPEPPRREDGRGRPWRDPRDVLDGILWILRTGAPWKDLIENATLPTRPATAAFRGGSKKGCSRARSKPWPKTSFREGRYRPLGMLHRRHLRRGQKRGARVGKTKRGKGTKIMAFSDGSSVPLALHAESASPQRSPLSRRLWRAPS